MGTPVNVLFPLGLKPSTEAIYRGMLRNPAWGITSLVKQLGFDEATIRSGLDELTDLALVRPSEEHPGRNVAVAPKVALDALYARRSADLLQERQALEESRSAAAQLLSELEGTRNLFESGTVERLVGADNVRTRIEELKHTATQEALAVMPPLRFGHRGWGDLRCPDSALLERGARVQVLIPESCRNDSYSRQRAKQLISMGGHVRTAPIVPSERVILDEAIVVIPDAVDESGCDGLAVHDPAVALAMKSTFLTLWNSAHPYEIDISESADQPTSQEQALLRLLAEGATDQMASTRLGISVRTVRRIMSDLMTRLNAGSRFEAGVRAKEHGWL
ncbi:LuxR C-terminal-related transcriptional regulator [Streptomyces sp. NPDC004126]|uniref:LuxR C-terminal-related transcriptional regulator n=1 Tax=Streptomyces sp. NPDC004126 TaxID=3390695 RepID=UPI003CFD9DC2